MTNATRKGSSLDGVGLYLDEVGRYSLLTRGQEVELAQKIEAGRTARQILDLARSDSPGLDSESILSAQERVRIGERAATVFVRANLRLVVSIARRYQGSGSSLADLIQDGNLGLIHAVEKFDWRRGFKFSTYATWWIRQAVGRGMAHTGRPIRLPIHVADLASNAYRLRHELSGREGRTATTAELARALEVAEPYLASVLAAARDARSLSETRGGGDEREFGDLIKDDSAVSPLEAAIDATLAADLDRILLSCLDDRERQILHLRFGLGNVQPRTLDEVGVRFGISRERVRQIEQVALSKLRNPQAAATARALLGD